MNLTRRTFLQAMAALGASFALDRNFTPKEVAALDEPIVSGGLGLFFRDEAARWQRVGDVTELVGPSIELELIDCTSHYDDSWRPKPFARDCGEVSVSVMGNPCREIEEGFHTARRQSFQLRLDKETSFEFDAYAVGMSKSASREGLFKTDMQLRITGAIAIS